MHGTMSPPCIRRKEKNTPDTHLDGRLGRTIYWNIHHPGHGFLGTKRRRGAYGELFFEVTIDSMLYRTLNVSVNSHYNACKDTRVLPVDRPLAAIT